MKRKTALLVSGLMTGVVMVVALGLVQISGRFDEIAQGALAAGGGQTAATSAGTSSVPVTDLAAETSGEVIRLQSEVAAYREELQQAYNELQRAYDQIQILSRDDANGFQTSGDDRSDDRDGDTDEHRDEHGDDDREEEDILRLAQGSRLFAQRLHDD